MVNDGSTQGRRAPVAGGWHGKASGVRVTRAIRATLILAAVAVLASPGGRAAGAQDQAGAALPARPLAVLDQVGHLGDGGAQRLSVALLRHRAATEQSVLVLVVDRAGGPSLVAYAQTMAEHWGLAGDGQAEAALLVVARMPWDAAVILAPALSQRRAESAARERLADRARGRPDADGLVAAVEAFLVELRREAEARAEERARVAAELRPLPQQRRPAVEVDVARQASPPGPAAATAVPEPVPGWQAAALGAVPASVLGWLGAGLLAHVLRLPPRPWRNLPDMPRLALAQGPGEPVDGPTGSLRGAGARALGLAVGEVGQVQRSAASAAAQIGGSVLLLAVRTVPVPLELAAIAAILAASSATFALTAIGVGGPWVLAGAAAALALSAAAAAIGPVRTRLVPARWRRARLRSVAAQAVDAGAGLVLAIEASGRMAAVDAEPAAVAGVGPTLFDAASIVLERALGDGRAADGIVAAVGTCAALVAERRRDPR